MHAHVRTYLPDNNPGPVLAQAKVVQALEDVFQILICCDGRKYLHVPVECCRFYMPGHGVQKLRSEG